MLSVKLGDEKMISGIALRIMLLFLPGITAYFIIDKLTLHRKFDNRDVVLYVFLLGLLSYMIFYLIIAIFDIEYKIAFFEMNLDFENGNNSIDFTEILWVTGISVAVGIIITYIINYEIPHKFFRLIKGTTRFGEPSVLDKLMGEEKNRLIIIRDIEKKTVYTGSVKSMRIFDNFVEIHLEQVTVFKMSNDNVVSSKFHLPNVYLTRERAKLSTNWGHAIVRHPSYFLYITGFIGIPFTALSPYLFILYLGIPGYIISARNEEESLLEVFGDEYRVYQQRVGMFFMRFKKKKDFI